MRFSQFFIQRPIFAGVLSAIIFIAGALSLRLLPISEYPEVVPPTVVVRAMYPGANPQVIAETVPGARVVKAFNTTFAATLATGGVNGVAPTTVLVAQLFAQHVRLLLDMNAPKRECRVATAPWYSHAVAATIGFAEGLTVA